MKISEIYEKLDEFSPFILQEEWDNSGLIVGSFADEFEIINISLDLDENIIKNAKKNTLFITHHPLIFKGLKKIDNFYPSNLLKEIIKKDCYLISMHTNIDKTHLNRYVTEKILGQKIEKCEDFICYFDINMSFDDFVLHVKKKLNINTLKVVHANKKIKKIALVTGSGGNFIEKINADCFLTGDIKYHQAFTAMSNNLALIDIGHFESETFFSEILHEYLKNFPIQAIMSDCKNPFEYK